MQKQKPKRKVGRPPKAKKASKSQQIRYSDEQYRVWSEAAKRDGFIRGEGANLTGWLKSLAEQRAKELCIGGSE